MTFVSVSASSSVRCSPRARGFQVVRAVTSTTLREMADRYYDAGRPALPRKVTGKSVQTWSVCTLSKVDDRSELILSSRDTPLAAQAPPTAVHWVRVADQDSLQPAILERIICE
ncbi:hypothetical protein COCSUDRAFT_53738 [Coccomyxa subellipsoidea C-169]|uniref:Uncharacterized protein n=1 Tax=Coccomyxa subellipsoidea (strain C-169) TaxID=574566 RepID=I0YV16_COCSC|nr:hypothetical protein COCSUDRAFT_53738 [Coccomyxa subellipsoidea C-169]EIE22235.1 hypothetical protein COCSUDRAFT_53738 [Coccomyxa subellipsoidea C-169]|eukprot:XP_005646779.1 hypothetical protein COCSUDRAFT_53738 [Coccomyxa subellipsoidea C-169]